MDDFSDDLVLNIVHQGIKRGISVTYDHQCYGSCVCLIYSAMDSMAFLGMSPESSEVRRNDFVNWVDRYVSFSYEDRISGLEFYAARCAMLHTYGTESGISREGQVRQIGYVDVCVPAVQVNAAVSTELVMVSIAALRDSLFSGIDRFLVDVFSDRTRASVAESRLQKLVMVFPRRPN